MFLGACARFQVSSSKNYVLVCFSLNCIKDKHFRFISGEQFHLILLLSFMVCVYILNSRSSHFVLSGARARFQVLLLKNQVLVFFLLNSIGDKYSRFISGEQFQLMFLVSFPFRIQISEAVVSCL